MEFVRFFRLEKNRWFLNGGTEITVTLVTGTTFGYIDAKDSEMVVTIQNVKIDFSWVWGDVLILYFRLKIIAN